MCILNDKFKYSSTNNPLSRLQYIIMSCVLNVVESTTVEPPVYTFQGTTKLWCKSRQIVNGGKYLLNV